MNAFIVEYADSVPQPSHIGNPFRTVRAFAPAELEPGDNVKAESGTCFQKD